MSRGQQQIPLTSQYFRSTPKPNTYNNIDYISFIWSKNFDPRGYNVAVESLNTASDRFLLIGKLDNVLQLPNAIFPWDARVLVVPEDGKRTTFVNTLTRGSTYQLMPQNRQYSPMRSLVETTWGNTQ